MPRPGWDVVSRNAPIAPQIPTDVGVWFVVGATAKGPTKPAVVRSLTEYEAVFGARAGGAVLYDAVDVFFREGGGKCYVSAIPTTPSTLDVAAAAAPVVDRAELEAMTRAELDALAAEQGIDSVPMPNKDAVIDALIGAGGVPEQQALTTQQITDSLDEFTAALGPGQVSVPGSIDPAVNSYLLAHAASRNRVALIEAAPGLTAAALETYAGALHTDANARYGALFAPSAIVPGIAGGTTRTVAWTAVEAGIIARNDSRDVNPNVPAAGVNGESSFAIDVSDRYTDIEYTALNDAGCNMAQYRWGALETYGYRSLVATPTSDWWDFGNCRLNMAISAQAGVIAEQYVFSQIDGRGKRIAQFGGDLRGMLVPFYEADALYGVTSEDAFQVNVGPAVNTPTTIAAGELHAVLMVRMSPFSEYVEIEIVKVATTQAIAA